MEEATSYINLLIDSLKQKKALLVQVREVTRQQSEIAKKENFKLIEFEETLNKKEQIIKQIELADNAFNSIYERVRQDILKNKEAYKDSITQLKGLINEVSELSIAIQVEEERNKKAIEQQLSRHKKEIKQFKNSRKTATNYYKSMNNVHQDQSYFVDKKN